MTCTHHWLLETEAPSTYGTCKFCGERRFFEGHVNYSYRELNEMYFENTRRFWAPTEYRPAPYVL